MKRPKFLTTAIDDTIDVQRSLSRHGIAQAIGAAKKLFTKGDLRGAENKFRAIARQINQRRQLTGEIPVRVDAEEVWAEGFRPSATVRPLLDLAINELRLNSRVSNVCHDRGWTFLGHIARSRPQDWLNISNFGRKSLTEVAGVLFCCHLQFGMDLMDWVPLSVDPAIGPVSSQAALQRAQELQISLRKRLP